MATPLSHRQVEVFLLPIAEWDISSMIPATIPAILSEKEWERFQRFRPQSKKNEFVASRLLLKALLHRYSSCNIENTEAVPDDLGRPFWLENGLPVDLFFSLSHTKGLVCCSISKDRETGCDVESLERRKYQEGLTERVMSDTELEVYHNLPPEQQPEFFYRSWTLKEAYVKAVGQGLRISFTSLSFTDEALKQETFMVQPEQLCQPRETSPYTVISRLPLPGYSLGVATSIPSPEIRLHILGITGDEIRFP